MRLVSLLATAAAIAGGGLAMGMSTAAGTDGAGYWSAPASLGACPASAAAHVVFPSDSPEQGTGAGAVVWEAAAGCPGGAGARVAAIGARGTPGVGVVPRTSTGRRLALGGPLAVTGAPAGQVLIAGVSPQRPAEGLAIEGGASGPFSALGTVEFSSAPVALATAYLGDVALAAEQAPGWGSGLRVHVQRHYAPNFAPGIRASAGHGVGIGALTVALDYRSDALAVWAQTGAIYARELPASGAPGPVQRLAQAGDDVRIAALLSDDDRAIVAWSERHGTHTSVYLDRSHVGVRFAAPSLLERYEDPHGVAPPAASPTLVRLSSESVMMAWAGAARGRWVVRTAAIDRVSAPSVATIAAVAGHDALLDDLAPGPDGDALVLWSEPQRTAAGTPDTDRNAIFAARGIDAYPGRPIFASPEQVAPPGPNTAATAAFDPESDRALAVWRGVHGAIEYALRNVSPGR